MPERIQNQILQILENSVPVYTGAQFSLRRHVPEMLLKLHLVDVVMDTCASPGHPSLEPIDCLAQDICFG